MKLVPIFANETPPSQRLYGVSYVDGTVDAFTEFFDRLYDVEWVRKFCKYHEDDIKKSFPGGINQAVMAILEEAGILEKLMLKMEFNKHLKLQQVFKPLSNHEHYLYELQLSKASAKIRHWHKPVLRLYGIRIDADSYVITGGAIKLTHRMEDRQHTKIELKKLERVRNWLKAEGIFDGDDLTQFT